MENGSAYDHETGEIHVPVSARATNGAAHARVEIERMRNGHGESALHGAIFLAMQDLPCWVKAEHSGGKGKYATLKDILAVVRPALAAHGVRIRQGADKSWPADDGGGMKGRLVPVYTDLIHVFSGGMERTTIEIPLLKLDPQAMGSAITYGKRYSLLAALGLATDEADDDGEAAKVREITEKSSDSPDLAALKAEMKALADKEKVTDDRKLEELGKWGMDPKTRTRLNKLSPDEQERARAFYSSIREKLATAE